MTNKPLLAAVLLLLIALVAYGNAFQHDFLLDDHSDMFQENNLGDVPFSTILLKGYRSHYRPLGGVIMKCQIMLFKDNPIGYHVVNFIEFWAICFLFYLIIYKLSGNFELALLASCCFAAHPIHNNLVNFKSANGVNVYILCMQISTLFFLKYLDRNDFKFYGLSILFYFLSLVSHDIAFMLPVYFFLILYFLKDHSLKRNVLTCLPYAAPFIIYMAIRSQTKAVLDIFTDSLSFNQYVGTLTKLIGWYLSKLVVPTNIIFIWDEKIVNNSSTIMNVFFLVAVVAIFVFLFLRGRKHFLGFSVALFLSGFLPLFLASFAYTFHLDTANIQPHYFGFTSIGFFILAAGLFLYLRRFINDKVWISLMVLIVGTTAIYTHKGNVVWADETTYCDYWLSVNQNSGTPRYHKAAAYVRQHDKGLDFEQYANCSDIASIGGSLYVMSEVGKAIEYYGLAIEKDKHCQAAYYGLGVLYMGEGDNRKAELSFMRSTFQDQYFFPAYQKLIEIYDQQGNTQKANSLRKFIIAAQQKLLTGQQ